MSEPAHTPSPLTCTQAYTILVSGWVYPVVAHWVGAPSLIAVVLGFELKQAQSRHTMRECWLPIEMMPNWCFGGRCSGQMHDSMGPLALLCGSLSRVTLGAGVEPQRVADLL